MLTAGELVDLRAQAEASFDQTCTIQQATQTNTKGSVEESFSNRATGVACRLAPDQRPREYTLGMGRVSVSEFILTIPWDQAIEPSDRVVVSSETYEVLGVADDHSYRTARRAYLARVD